MEKIRRDVQEEDEGEISESNSARKRRERSVELVRSEHPYERGLKPEQVAAYIEKKSEEYWNALRALGANSFVECVTQMQEGKITPRHMAAIRHLAGEVSMLYKHGINDPKQVEAIEDGEYRESVKVLSEDEFAKEVAERLYQQGRFPEGDEYAELICRDDVYRKTKKLRRSNEIAEHAIQRSEDRVENFVPKTLEDIDISLSVLKRRRDWLNGQWGIIKYLPGEKVEEGKNIYRLFVDTERAIGELADPVIRTRAYTELTKVMDDTDRRMRTVKKIDTGHISFEDL